MKDMMGYVLIGIGTLFVLATYSGLEMQMDVLWPAFLLIPGIGLHLMFFMNPQPKRAGLLVPGGILMVYAPLFFFSALLLDGDMSKTWPVFLLGPAVGLFELYIFGGRKHALLIPISLLTVVAFIFLASNLLSTQIGGILGLILIVCGGFILIRKKQSDTRF
ncbi:MAG TPA: hypothetical protein VEZ13_18450 [Brevibacillus sp.]|nr:hypothetical protein [Brevibacillus sp.]